MDDDWIDQDSFRYLIPGGLPKISIRTVYLFYEKGDVLEILYGRIILRFKYVALVAVDFLITPRNIDTIRAAFRNAKFITVFGNDLPAIVLTCKISLWLKGLDATFCVYSDHVHFIFRYAEFSCAASIFSLNRFCRLTGFRTNVKLLKVYNNCPS